MPRNRIILENLPLIYIKETLKKNYLKTIKIDEYEIITSNNYYNVLVKYDFTCAICGKKATFCNLEYNTKYKYHLNAYTEEGELLTRDHIYPKSKGGLDSLKNYQLLCHSCNQKKKDNTTMTLVTALREGYVTKRSVEKAVKNGKPNALIGV